MNTGDTIKKIASFRDEVNRKLSEREVISFNIGSIDILGDTMLFEDRELSESAIKKVLSQLRVKNNFLGLKDKMTNTDWQIINEKLKSTFYNQTIYGRVIEQQSKKIIDDIYLAAPKTTGLIEINEIFDEIISALISTHKNMSLKEYSLLDDLDEITLTLLENDNEIDVFSDGSDMWKVGKHIAWNNLNFSIAPFYERLVCANGNIGRQYGFKSNISNNKFNIIKIQDALEKEIISETDDQAILIDSTNELRRHNVSVREFLTYRKFFDEERHEYVLDKWFDVKYLNMAYKTDVEEMNTTWQITANSGKNAYDFFNDLTYIASHPEETKLDEREKLELQIKTSDLMFKKTYDLENVAPILDWEKIRKNGTRF